MQSKPPRHTDLKRLRIRSEKLSRFLAQRGRIVEAAQGAYVIDPDGRPDTMCLLLSGTLRVEEPGTSREKNALYSVCSDETPAFATPCLIQLKRRPARAMAETDVEAMFVGRTDFDALMVLSKGFRAFVFDAYSRQIARLFDEMNGPTDIPCHILAPASDLNWPRSLGPRGLAH